MSEISTTQEAVTPQKPERTFGFWITLACCVFVLILPFFLTQSLGVATDLTFLRLLKFLAAALGGLAAGLALLGAATGGGAIVAAGSQAAVPAVVGATVAVSVGSMVVVSRSMPEEDLSALATVAAADSSIAANPTLATNGTIEAQKNNSETISPSLSAESEDIASAAGNSVNTEPERGVLEIQKDQKAEFNDAKPAVRGKLSDLARLETPEIVSPPEADVNLKLMAEAKAAEEKNAIAAKEKADKEAKAAEILLADKKAVEEKGVKSVALKPLGYPIDVVFNKKSASKTEMLKMVEYESQPKEMQYGDYKPYIILADDKRLYIDEQEIETLIKKERRAGILQSHSSSSAQGWVVYQLIRKKSIDSQTFYSVELLIYRKPNNADKGSHLFKVFSPILYKSLSAAQSANDFSIRPQ